MAEGARRLAAIMFTDIAGYTSLTQSNESRALEILDAHNGLLRPIFPRFGGREVKTMGDSFLVEFDSALDALRCAVQIQEKVRGYNSAAGQGKGVNIRIGVHLGDVVHRDGDVFGDAVNISSRIQPLAPPGGVCISRQVYDQVRNKFDLPLESMGEKGLKGVEDPTEVFAVVMPWEKRDSGPPPGARRVAVLPFANLSPDPNDEFFADGMTEEVISTVSRIEGTEVISRTSVMQYKRTPKPMREISKELEVGTILEGSVRKAGNRLRVTVQMIDAAKDRHIWAENYDRNMDDIFAIQSDIASQVAGALRARLPGSSLTPTADLGAYTLYLRAQQVANEGSQRSMQRAVDLLEAATRKDPKFVKAYAELAILYRHMSFFGDYQAELGKAEAAAKKALEHGEGTAEAHAAMAEVDMAQDRFDSARSHVREAVRINPNLAVAQRLLGEAAGALGSLDEAVESFRRAAALDPLSMINYLLVAETLRASGKVDEALDILAVQRELHPESIYLFNSIVASYAQKGEYEMAMKEADEVIRLNPGMPEAGVLRGVVLGLMGEKEKAEAQLASIMDRLSATARSNARLSVSASVGDLDGAFAVLSELAALHAWPFLIRVDPFFASVRKDPRFNDFCRSVGIPPVAQ